MKKIYLATGIDRLWHWVHATGIILLLLTGFQIHFVEEFSVFEGFSQAVDQAGAKANNQILLERPRSKIAKDRYRLCVRYCAELQIPRIIRKGGKNARLRFAHCRSSDCYQ